MAGISSIVDRVSEAQPIMYGITPPLPGRVLHIDGDVLAYQAGGNDDTTVAESRNMLMGKLRILKEASRSERVVMHLSASNSTKGDRSIIAVTKPYQGNRKGSRKPKNWQYLRTWMENYNGPEFRTKIWVDREADDGLGFISSEFTDRVIATNDKDMRMLPGLHIDWNTLDIILVKADDFEVTYGSTIYGMKWFLLQMLMGDTADNIPGVGRIPGMSRGTGAATAGALLKGLGLQDSINVVVKTYKDTHGDAWADMFAEQAGLLWIRRDKDATIGNFVMYLQEFLSREDLQALRTAVKGVESRVDAAYAQATKCLLGPSTTGAVAPWNMKEEH